MIYLVFITPLFLRFPGEIRALALLVIMQVLWIGRVFPLAYSSILLMLILSFHFMSYGKVLGFVGTPVVWLLFATYLLSGAFIRSGLAHRLSLKILSWSKGSSKKIVVSSFFLMSILAFMIPSNIGRASLVTSILDKVIISINKVDKVTRLSKALFISMCYITALSGALLATGASSTIYTFGFINDHLKVPLTFFQWLVYTVPPILIFMILFWIVLNFLFPFEKINSEAASGYIEEELKKNGRLKMAEIKMMLIIGGTVLLWLLEPLHHFSVPLIGLLGGAATLFPGMGIWKWQDAKQKINWDMILFFASTLMLSDALIKSGLLKWISSRIIALVNADHLFWLLVVSLIFIFLLRVFFVNVLGIMTFIIPLSFSIGEQLPNVSPVLFPLVFFLAGIPGFFLITQSPVHMISFASGYFTEKELLKTGIVASIIWLIILIPTAFFYWNNLLTG